MRALRAVWPGQQENTSRQSRGGGGGGGCVEKGGGEVEEMYLPDMSPVSAREELCVLLDDFVFCWTASENPNPNNNTFKKDELHETVKVGHKARRRLVPCTTAKP